MKLSVKTLSTLLAITFVVLFASSDVMAQRGQGGGGRGLGPGMGLGGGIPGSVNCIYAGTGMGYGAYCRYFDTGMTDATGLGRGNQYRYHSEMLQQVPNRAQKMTGNGRNFGNRGAGRGYGRW